MWGLEINFWGFFSLLGGGAGPSDLFSALLLPPLPVFSCSVPWPQRAGWEILDYPMGPGSIPQLRRATVGASSPESTLTGVRRGV